MLSFSIQNLAAKLTALVALSCAVATPRAVAAPVLRATSLNTDVTTPPNNTDPAIANFGTQRDFFFGLATAPAHVEDNLEDGWIRFGRQGKIAAFKNHFEPEKRTLFWSNPEPDLNLAQESNAKVLRLGVDWGRLVPHKPGSNNCDGICEPGVQDKAALSRYKDIVKMARARGLSVMMTLFHHSMPVWAIDVGGWTNPEMVSHFEAFTADIVKEFASDVDLWITVNEPAPFLLFTYVAGMWPGGPEKPDFKQLLNFPGAKGAYSRAFDNLVEAHRRAYKTIRALDTTFADPKLPGAAPARVGIAHNVTWSVPARIIDIVGASFFDSIAKYAFPDAVADSLDFLGLNYYGREIVKGTSVRLSPNKEYSESGRNIYPQALHTLIKQFHDRYNFDSFARSRRPPLPFIITENGIADSTDILRPSYIIEHLLAIAEARKEGVPIQGFVHWTISDNMEWLDGYCPKFGLAEVKRDQGFRRVKRDSFHLFANIAKSGIITQGQRDAAWSRVVSNIGTPHPMCRAADGKSSLDVPIMRPIVRDDWRFVQPKK
jgi:beta-glucosidase/6-phospho-beta-glucosidase/beta-galactosidase